MRIAYHQRTARPEVAEALGATFVEDLDRLASVSDVLTLHAPQRKPPYITLHIKSKEIS
jgi:lactate dehydrogenase-like 2-hydroxyacid dehydrogenase